MHVTIAFLLFKLCFPHCFSQCWFMPPSQENHNKLTLSFLFCLSLITLLSSYQPLPLPTCQPIVFVSDRARANKEIEHDGIRGEKKKPKVCTDRLLSLSQNADAAAIPHCDLWPVVISREWRLWNAILTGSNNISGNKTIEFESNWSQVAGLHLLSCKASVYPSQVIYVFL